VYATEYATQHSLDLAALLIPAGAHQQEQPASDHMDISPPEELHPLPPTTSMRRKSVLPSDADVAAALADYRPSPPPAPLPGD
jgi:hypothetical protein